MKLKPLKKTEGDYNYYYATPNFWLMKSLNGIFFYFFFYNSYRINIYHFRAFWLDKSTATCFLLIHS